MDSERRRRWDEKHRGRPAGGAPEAFVVQALALLPTLGLALDVASGRGRHSLLLARRGFRVVAADYSEVAARALKIAVDEERLPIFPAVLDLDTFPFVRDSFDLIVNVNYLDRALFPEFMRALRAGGAIIADTFVDLPGSPSHPISPRFMLKPGELAALLPGAEILRSREEMVSYPDGSRAWRAGLVARRA